MEPNGVKSSPLKGRLELGGGVGLEVVGKSGIVPVSESEPQDRREVPSVPDVYQAAAAGLEDAGHLQQKDAYDGHGRQVVEGV